MILDYAIRTGNLLIVRQLFDDPRIKYSESDEVHAHISHGFELASRKGDADIVLFLLTRGCGVFRGASLAVASAEGHANVVQLLLNDGADPSSRLNSAILAASTNGHIDVVRLLLKDHRILNSEIKRGQVVKARDAAASAEIRELISQALTRGGRRQTRQRQRRRRITRKL